MDKRIALVAGVLLFTLSAVSSSVAQAADPWMGTWKVNLAKSTFSPGPKPMDGATIKMESMSGQFMTTIDAKNAEGQPIHTQTMGNFDGKDYQVVGAPAPGTTNAYKRIDARTFEAMGKVNGKPSLTTRVTISADGKTLTATQTGTNPQGQAVKNVIAADKQ